MDSLRSIAEGMEHVAAYGGWRSKEKPRGADGRELLCAHDCPKCRLLALCDEAEKTDLVQRLRMMADELSKCADKGCMEAESIYRWCADELATWLAARAGEMGQREAEVRLNIARGWLEKLEHCESIEQAFDMAQIQVEELGVQPQAKDMKLKGGDAK